MKIILDEKLFEDGSNSLKYGKGEKTAKGSIINSEPFNEWDWILDKKFEVVSLQKMIKINHLNIDNYYYYSPSLYQYFIDCDIDTIAEHIAVKVDDNIINFADVPCKIDGLEFQYYDYLFDSKLIKTVKAELVDPFQTLMSYKIPVTSFDGLLGRFDTSSKPKMPVQLDKANTMYSFHKRSGLIPFYIKITDPEVIDYINNVIKSK